MVGLQRSSETFRRSGSSGLVWEDKPAPGRGAEGAVERSRSTGNNGGRRHEGYRAIGHVAPAIDPPSPRVAVCGFCRLFGGGGDSGSKGKSKSGKAKANKGRRH